MLLLSSKCCCRCCWWWCCCCCLKCCCCQHWFTSLPQKIDFMRKNSSAKKSVLLLVEFSFHWFRSSRPEVLFKIDILWSFAKLTGKHQCQSLFFNKVAGLRPAISLKNRLWHRCFPVNFAKFLRTPFLTENFRQLILLILARGFD